MARICFVCDEVYPVKPGGAGSLIFNLAKVLLAEGHEVIFVLDLSRDAFERFETSKGFLLPNSEKCRAYRVETLCAKMLFQISDFLSRHLWESCRYDYACRQVYDLEKPDLIEFYDYRGPAFYALCAKISGLSYLDSHIAIRVHGPIELIDRNSGTEQIDFDRYALYALERQSLRLAETVLYPTTSFLQEYRHTELEPWFGQAVLAQPVIVSFPERSRQDPGANIALFYGRLFSVKGVDLFVDAAVRMLEEKPGSNLEFYLVGYDSMEPPASGPHSYQDYLWRKIPSRHRAHFTFTGLLTHDKLEELLPRVLFAVFPSHYETYCFAAHELRMAGIPLIVSNIPAFRDNLVPGRDALFFDGSVNDLVRKMNCLDEDEGLRSELSQAYLPDMGVRLDFYRNLPHSSWITSRHPSGTSALLVCILDEGSSAEQIDQTLNTLENSRAREMRLLLLRKLERDVDPSSAVWLLDGYYSLHDLDGRPVPSLEVRTMDALLLLRPGDRLDSEYIPLGLDLLSRQPQVSFVVSWQRIRQWNRSWLYTHPLAAMVELSPFESLSPLNRCIMRTSAGELLIDLFDQNAGPLAEIAYLWKLDNNQACGIQIPAVLVERQVEIGGVPNNHTLPYLLLHDLSATRAERLVRYLALLTNAYPRPFLPLQEAWTQKNGKNRPQFPIRNKNVVVRQGWLRSMVYRVSQGGAFSQHLLATLRWFRRRLRAFRSSWKKNK